MKFAIARELITPYKKVTMSGYASREEEFLTIHDDFYVKCLFIDSKKTKLFIVAFDLLHYNYPFNEKIFDYLQSKYQISKEQVIISYSHTHAGPKVSSHTERFDESPLESYYLERTLLCIDRTFTNIQVGSLHYGVTSGRWNINRRRVTNEGIKLAPNYEGITDDELSVLIVKDNQQTIKGVLFNYSCHPVTLSGTLHLSSEFPGRVNQLIEAEYYGATCFFLQGAAGNMRPKITAKKERFRPCTFNEVDELAKSIKNSINLLIVNNNYKEITPNFKGSAFPINVAIQPLDKAFFEKRLTEVSGYIVDVIKNLLEHFDEQDDNVTIHAGFIKMSDNLYIVYMGGEICYEVKLAVKEVFKDSDVIFLGYHEALTYIPSDKIIKEGGYEGIDAPTYSGFRGPFKIGIDQTIKETFKKKLF